jgi:hypothetical protein
MKKKTILTVVALIAALTALVYLAVLFLWQFGVLPEIETDESLFTKGYLFLPLPVIALVACILLQVFSVRSGKKRKKS